MQNDHKLKKEDFSEGAGEKEREIQTGNNCLQRKNFKIGLDLNMKRNSEMHKVWSLWL